MNSKLITCALVVASAAAMSCSRETCDPAGIVPAPVSVEYGDGNFSFGPATVISVESGSQAEVASWFCDLFSASAGFTPEVVTGDAEGADVVFRSDSLMKGESYRLEVSRKRIHVTAKDERGFFYALQTLRQYLPASIDSDTMSDDVREWSVPAMDIYDEPRFGYRGLMLDVARHFMPKEDVLRIIDCMAMLKLNTLHWHLTDDNGWRIEIRKYPLLTDVGAWRVDREDEPFPARRNQRPGEKATSGGFYTQSDIREVVSYAAARQIEVIPEIDMPAHSNAALAAYPQYACPVAEKPVTVLPGLGEGRWDVIFCAGNENAYTFIEGILDEVMELFPSDYIHIGGDEAQKTNWEKCPLCQSLLKRESLGDEEHLQGYFMGRIASYLREHGKTVIGWDELVKSKLPEGAVICGWQGDGRSAFKAASQGHRFIMTPAKVMYLIRYQGPQWFEPLTYFGNNTLKDVYEYDPSGSAGWKPEYAPLMMGLQASMWTEFCRDTDDVTYQLFPRLAALAELSWSADASRDWAGFLPRLDAYLEHLDAKGVVYAASMYNIQHTVRPAGGSLEVILECIRPDVDIRYTLDGSDPDGDSPVYSDPLAVSVATEVRAATFDREGRMKGAVLELPLEWNLATARPVYGGTKDSYMLTNGVKGSLRQSDFEWYTDGAATAGRGEEVSFTVDLLQDMPVSGVSLTCLVNYSMAVSLPLSVSVSLSRSSAGDDVAAEDSASLPAGLAFNTAGNKVFSDKEIFSEGNFHKDISFNFAETYARYVKVTVGLPGPCPEDHVRPGQGAKFYIDEIAVY